ncbi:orotate phosphoribosyltransferase [bacterium K02(2017)]|nr:orotate phosphoribosyltransferase [bacterium K02(2017)]
MDNKLKSIEQILLQLGAVSLNPTEPFTYASGIKSPIYCDNRLMISFPQERQQVTDSFIKQINQHQLEFDVIAGTATAGIPWGAWVAHELNKPMIYIRSNAKAHGKENQIEGKLEAGQKVIVIEDLISSGGSSIAAIKSVQSTQAEVVACLAIFTYQMKQATQNFLDINIPLYTLSCFTDLVNYAVEQNFINEDQRTQVLEWGKDPQGWGQRYGFAS